MILCFYEHHIYYFLQIIPRQAIDASGALHRIERKYQLDVQGFDFEGVVGRVAEVMSMTRAEILSRVTENCKGA